MLIADLKAISLKIASSVTVDLLSKEEPLQPKYLLLSSLKSGEKAEIVGISSKCRGQERRRLMDFGIIPGTVVLNELENAFGNPTAYRVMGTTIALRNELADNIFIKPLNVK